MRSGGTTIAARAFNVGYLRSGQIRIALVCLIIAHSIAVARCDDTIRRLPDGRYLVHVKDVTIALPEEDPKNTRTQFQVATPPGTSPLFFTLTDLLRDPDRYASKLKSSEWSSVSAVTSVDHPLDILGVQVVRGVNMVGVHSGPDRNCEAWNRDWAHARDAAIVAPSDQYGWIRQDHPRSPPWTGFIKFLDEHDRAKSQYYALICNFAGSCLLSACHNDLTAWIRFHSSNKIQGEDFAVKDFDQQITSGAKVLEHMLLGKPVDLSHP
jgi:hypothetical protein